MYDVIFNINAVNEATHEGITQHNLELHLLGVDGPAITVMPIKELFDHCRTSVTQVHGDSVTWVPLFQLDLVMLHVCILLTKSHWLIRLQHVLKNIVDDVPKNCCWP